MNLIIIKKNKKMSKMQVSEEVKQYIKMINKIKSAPKAKKLSGYNVFCMEIRKGMEGSPKEIMVKLGALWKASKKHDSFKVKAEKLNKESVAEFEATKEDEDSQLTELKLIIKNEIIKFKKNISKRVSEVVEEVNEVVEE